MQTGHQPGKADEIGDSNKNRSYSGAQLFNIRWVQVSHALDDQRLFNRSNLRFDGGGLQEIRRLPLADPDLCEVVRSPKLARDGHHHEIGPSAVVLHAADHDCGSFLDRGLIGEKGTAQGPLPRRHKSRRLQRAS